MAFKRISKSIDINASSETVWNTLFMPESYKKWAAEFSPDSEVISTWEEGSKAIFKDKTNSGLVGIITKNVPTEIMAIEYIAELRNDVENTESPEAQEIKGAIEKYILSEKDGITFLAIECDIPERYYDMMSAAWDKALMKIKELAENYNGK